MHLTLTELSSRNCMEEILVLFYKVKLMRRLHKLRLLRYPHSVEHKHLMHYSKISFPVAANIVKVVLRQIRPCNPEEAAYSLRSHSVCRLELMEHDVYNVLLRGNKNHDISL